MTAWLGLLIGAVRTWRVPITEVDRIINEVPWPRLVLMGAVMSKESKGDEKAHEQNDGRVLSLSEIEGLLNE